MLQSELTILIFQKLEYIFAKFSAFENFHQIIRVFFYPEGPALIYDFAFLLVAFNIFFSISPYIFNLHFCILTMCSGEFSFCSCLSGVLQTANKSVLLAPVTTCSS